MEMTKEEALNLYLVLVSEMARANKGDRVVLTTESMLQFEEKFKKYLTS